MDDVAQGAQPAELDGKVALVTGSSSGIGEACVRRLAALGCRVIVNSANSVEAGQSLAAEIGASAHYVQADISSEDDCIRLVDETVQRFGRMDILVNNAGFTKVIPHHDLDAVSEDVFRRIFDVNVFGTWYLSRAAMASLRASGDGNIVNITSIAGVRPTGSSIPYAMSKAALNHMTELMARVVGPEVRVNAVAPGLVATPWTSDWDAQHAAVAKRAPLHRSATPDDVAEAVLGIVRARYQTGGIVIIDGGTTLT
ncbi:MAG: SDR family NAD(P)-dependent oxidoreductase [Acidimicrobiales bacterium]|jgi:ketoreductase RED2